MDATQCSNLPVQLWPRNDYVFAPNGPAWVPHPMGWSQDPSSIYDGAWWCFSPDCLITSNFRSARRTCQAQQNQLPGQTNLVSVFLTSSHSPAAETTDRIGLQFPSEHSKHHFIYNPAILCVTPGSSWIFKTQPLSAKYQTSKCLKE